MLKDLLKMMVLIIKLVKNTKNYMETSNLLIMNI